MKFEDPWVGPCPACDQPSPQPVKLLLARQARCPFCDHSLADIGEAMQRMLDGWAGYVISIVIQLAIEKQNPQLKPADEYIVAEDEYRNLCLQHLVTATETQLNDVPASERRARALRVVESAFRTEFPDTECPPLDAHIVEYLRDKPVSLFGRGKS